MDLANVVQLTTEHFQKYLRNLLGYNERNFAFKQDGQTMSLGQMYEHLAIYSEFLSDKRKAV